MNAIISRMSYECRINDSSKSREWSANHCVILLQTRRALQPIISQHPGQNLEILRATAQRRNRVGVNLDELLGHLEHLILRHGLPDHRRRPADVVPKTGTADAQPALFARVESLQEKMVEHIAQAALRFVEQ